MSRAQTSESTRAAQTSESTRANTLADAINIEREKVTLPGFLESQQISEEFKRERYIEITLKELIIFSVFCSILFSVIFSVSKNNDFHYQYAIKQLYEERKFDCADYEVINMKEVRTMEEFWCFMNNSLIDSFNWKYWYSERDKVAEASAEDGHILFNNLVIGVPRIRQVRVTNESCEIHEEFQHSFKKCYGSYSSNTEDKNPIIPVNWQDAGRIKTCWTYSTTEELGSLPFTTELTTYNGGGYYFDLTLDKTLDRELLEITKGNLWLSKATRAIFVDFTTFNANTNSFCFVKLLFEFPPSGGVYPSTHFHLLSLGRYLIDLNLYRLFILLLLLIIIVFTIYYITEEVNELIVLKYKTYFLSSWTILDLTIIMFLLLTIAGHIILSILVFLNLKNDGDQNLIEMKSYKSFDSLISYHKMHDNVMSWTMFFSAIKYLRLLKIFRFMRNLYRILYEASLFILSFAILFLLTIFACALVAHLQFGDKVYGLHTLYSSCCSLVLALVGQFDLHVLIEYDVAAGSTFAYFFIFLVVFIVANIIIAILNERYWIRNRVLRREVDEDLWEPIRFKLQKCFYKMGFKKCASSWFNYDQLCRSERKYNSLKDEIASKTNGTDEEVEGIMKKANVTRENAATIPPDELQRSINAANSNSLNSRIEQLEKEIKRMNELINGNK